LGMNWLCHELQLSLHELHLRTLWIVFIVPFSHKNYINFVGAVIDRPQSIKNKIKRATNGRPYRLILNFVYIQVKTQPPLPKSNFTHAVNFTIEDNFTRKANFTFNSEVAHYICSE